MGKPMDDLDKKILAVLQADAQKSLEKIAEQVGCGKTTVSNRIVRLQKSGIISQCRITLNLENMGGTHLLISLYCEDEDAIDKVKATIEQSQVVLRCFVLRGNPSYIAELYSQNDEAVEALIETLSKTCSIERHPIIKLKKRGVIALS